MVLEGVLELWPSSGGKKIKKSLMLFKIVAVQLIGGSRPPNDKPCLGTSLSQRYRSALREKTVLKQYPLGTTLENGTVFAKWHSFFLNNDVYKKIIPPRKRVLFSKTVP